jgi:4-hydroxyphenylpyruvate dioxygenase-like putative hemolysin
MFKIGKLFHVTHVVDNLDAVDKWYDDVFSCTRYYRGFEKVAGRVASLLVIGEVLMEPMTPARVANLQNQSVKRFHDRFGQHFHSIAWYAEDIPNLSTRLAEQKLRLWDVGGRPVTPPNQRFAIWTHPKETHGQLEFAVVMPFTNDPRLQPAWSNDFWRERHPLGIQGASHITFVVADLEKAKHFYCEVLGAKQFVEVETPGRKKSAFIAIGTDSVVELAMPLASNTREAEDLEKNGEGVHALTFKTRDLSMATDFLKSKGMRPQPDGADSVVLDRDQAFGMVIGFTREALPNDPR